MNALQRDYGPRGVQLVAINSNDPHLYPDESHARMVERAAEDGYTFPYLVDDGQRVAKAYGATCTFHVFVLDRDAAAPLPGPVRRLAARGQRHEPRPARTRSTICSAGRESGSRRRDRSAAASTSSEAGRWRVDRTARLVGTPLDAVAPPGHRIARDPRRRRVALAARLRTGAAAALHHHALIEGGPPLPVAIRPVPRRLAS